VTTEGAAGGERVVSPKQAQLMYQSVQILVHFIKFCLVHFMVLIFTIFTIYVVTAAEAYGPFQQ
jgi:hypothetical protein